MKIVLVKNTQTSLTEQLYGQIKSYALEKLDDGEEKMPSIRTLAVELGVSVITVKNAYEQLERDGYLSARQGSGFYLVRLDEQKVDEIKKEQTLKAKEFLAESKKSGLTKDQLLKLLDEVYE